MSTLIAACLALIDEPDNRDKFMEIYSRCADDMLHAAYEILRDHSLAEDAVQNALVNISLVIDSVDMSKNPRAFAITAARNEAKDIVKKYNREKEYIESCTDGGDGTESNLQERIENSDIVKKAADYILAQGSENYEIFMLRFYYGLTYKHIERLMKVPEATVRKRIQRIKKQLKENFKGEQ